MDAIDVAIRTAATWRITRLVVDDEIARPFREAVSKRWPGSKAEYLVNCPYCVSVWAGAAAAVMPKWLACSLAFSAGTLGAKWVAEVTESGAFK
jgi:hypothetical protein